MNPAELSPPDYERRDASPRAIVFTGAGLALAMAATLAFAARFYRAHFAPTPAASYDAAAASFQNGAAVQTSIARDWAEQDRSVRAHLESYVWVNRDAGIVRIPIERAMDVIAGEAAGRPKENAAR